VARIETDPNYTSPTFSRATAATDLFKKEDVQQVAAALSTHDHSNGKGVLVPTAGLAPNSIDGSKIVDGSIATAELADGAVTSAKIGVGQVVDNNYAAASITNPKILDHTIIAGQKLYNADFRSLSTTYVDGLAVIAPAPNGAQGGISFGQSSAAQINWNGGAWSITPALPGLYKLVLDVVESQDVWNSQGVAAGYNGVGGASGWPKLVTIDSGCVGMMVTVNMCALWGGGAASFDVGWALSVQNGGYYKLLTMQRLKSGITDLISCCATTFIPASAWGGGSGGRQFGVALFSSAAFGSLFYLRPASASPVEFYRLQLTEVF
jgi:hypothetical protein